MGSLLNKGIASAAVLALFAAAALGQSPSDALGVLEDTASYARLPLMPLFEAGQKGVAGLPPARSLRAYCPVPLDQGGTSACSGFAAGYGAMTILQALKTGISDREAIRGMACSPWYLYNQIKLKAGNCTGAATMEAAITVLREQGICLNAEFRPQEGDCDALPGAAARLSAASRRLKDAAALFEFRAAPEKKTASIRSTIAGGLPVVATIQTWQSFREQSYGVRTWKLRNRQTDAYLGQHFLVVTGYDDRSETFELMSSWGVGWADGGFCYVPYDEFARICQMAYVFLPEHFVDPGANDMPAPIASGLKKKTPDSVSEIGAAVGQATPAVNVPGPNPDATIFLQGQFEWVLPVWDVALQAFKFVPQEVTYDGSHGCYIPTTATYPVGTSFQLHSSAIPTGKYVYVFSCDPLGKVSLHWPKNETQAQFVPGSHAVISMPSAGGAFRISHPGDDFLCVLYCDDPVPDIRHRLGLLQDYSADNISQKFHTLFGDLLFPAEKIRYDTGNMRVRGTALRKEGTAIGIILKVRGE